MKKSEKNKLTKKIGKNLKRKRLEAGIGVTELAEQIGIHRNNVHAKERGEGLDGVAEFVAMCEKIGCQPGDMF